MTTPTPPPRSPAAFAERLAGYDRLVASGAEEGAIARARDAVDQAAAQRDAHVSRLYWYTDLEEAKAEARRSGRPILSLRMLGKLDQELSCANSRLFRIVLYANRKLSTFLRDTYVLHWSSERPVPQVTVDFGDGRVVKRTVAGNSAHYVLDTEGRVVDVLPGMYGPAQFERHLRESLDLAKRTSVLGDDTANKAIATHHLHAVWSLTAAWRQRLVKVYAASYGEDYAEKASLPSLASFSSDPLYASLPASTVAALTYSKADTEAPTLALLQPSVHTVEDFGSWQKVTSGLPIEHLDASSLALLAAKHPRDWATPEATALGDAQLGKRVARFEARLTQEEFRNEFMFHGAVHQRMAKPVRLDFASLNDFVYARLFHTPQSDAWLGLGATEALTAQADDGLVAAAAPVTPEAPVSAR